MVESIKAGLGAGFVTCNMGDGFEGVRRVRPKEPGFGMDVWLLTHPDLRRSARVRAFMDLVWERMHHKT